MDGFDRIDAHLMDDMRRLVSLVNWHLTFRLEHSEQLEVSVASHFGLHQSHSIHRWEVGV